MITIFRSKASGDVIMFGDVAEKMMTIMGKAAEAKGIVTVEQLPGAISLLQAAIDADKAARQGVAPEDLPQFETAPDGSRRPYISLTQRATPLLELLNWSLKKKVPVTWGV